jgi:hypothetical protein
MVAALLKPEWEIHQKYLSSAKSGVTNHLRFELIITSSSAGRATVPDLRWQLPRGDRQRLITIPGLSRGVIAESIQLISDSLRDRRRRRWQLDRPHLCDVGGKDGKVGRERWVIWAMGDLGEACGTGVQRGSKDTAHVDRVYHPSDGTTRTF